MSGSSEPTRQPLTCSTADTRASLSPSQGSEKGPTTPATSGPSSPDSFAFYDPESSSLRTSQATFDLGFTPSLPTLPAWGWMSGGELYERPMSEPLTSALDSSSLLPTATTEPMTGTPRATRGGSQTETVALLPTPVAQDDQKQPAAHLAKKVDSGAGETITSLTVMSRQYAETGEWSNKLLPTPAAADGERGPDYAAETRDGTGGTPVPTGVSIPPPSDDGKPSPETLLDPPTKEAA